MQKIKGKLQFMGWFNLPWKLVTDNGEIDLWPIVNKFLVSLNGKNAKHEQERNCYTLTADETSEFRFKYIPGEYILLEKANGSGMFNVYAYLEDALVRLSGRMVEIEIEDEKQLKFTADKSEEVFGVYFIGDGNSCDVPKGAEQTICKISQEDCCVFLTVGAYGFSCGKFSGSAARALLDRLAKGNIRASRIGNCVLLGRKEK